MDFEKPVTFSSTPEHRMSLDERLFELKPDPKGFRYILMWMEHLLEKQLDADPSYILEWKGFVEDCQLAIPDEQAIKGVLQTACDRDWKDETLYQTAVIAANAIYWRDRKITELEARLLPSERSAPIGPATASHDKTVWDAARYRFLERMWPIDLLMLLNSHMGGLDDMLVGEAIDKAMAAQIPRHK